MCVSGVCCELRALGGFWTLPFFWFFLLCLDGCGRNDGCSRLIILSKRARFDTYGDKKEEAVF